MSTTENLSRLELLARAADLSQRAFVGNQLIEQRRYQEACANWDPYDEATQSGVKIEDPTTQIPVLDYITQFPLDLKDRDGNDDVVVLSDGKCYSKQNMRTFLQSGTVSLGTGYANFPETGKPLSDLDYALIGLESPSFDTEANRAARERTSVVTYDQLMAEATPTQRAREQRLRQERQLDPAQREEAERRRLERGRIAMADALQFLRQRRLQRRLFFDRTRAERLLSFADRQTLPESQNAFYAQVADKLSEIDVERYSLLDFLTWYRNETAQGAPLFRYDVETNGRMLKNLSDVVNPYLAPSIDPIGEMLDLLPASHAARTFDESQNLRRHETIGRFPVSVLGKIYTESQVGERGFLEKNWLERRPELFVLGSDHDTLNYNDELGAYEIARNDNTSINTSLVASLIRFVYNQSASIQDADSLANSIVDIYMQSIEDPETHINVDYLPGTVERARDELTRVLQNAHNERARSRQTADQQRVTRSSTRQQQRSSRIARQFNPL